MSKNHIQYQDLPQTYKRKICYKYLCIFTYTDFLHFTNNVLRMATVSPLNQTLCSYFKFYFFFNPLLIHSIQQKGRFSCVFLHLFKAKKIVHIYCFEHS